MARLTVRVESAYAEVHESIGRSPEEHRAEIVQRLLVDAPVGSDELGELDYEFDAWHLGMVAVGGLQEDVWRVAGDLECWSLHIARGNAAWGWIGARRKLGDTELERLLLVCARCDSLAVGGLWRGLAGWRQTHREAKGALRRALKRPGDAVHYADGPLLSAALENATLAEWLREFLAPLVSRPDGGVMLLETLRAYLEAECNFSAAASILNVRRQTVTNRIRTAEQLLGRQLGSCLAELDTALRLVNECD